jgi:hypothetical protein
MSRREHGAGAVDFELTVEGRLGPVLRWGLRPHTVVAAHTCTTIRAVSSTDLTGMVALLNSRGLRIESVWLLPPEPGDGERT